MGVRIGLLGSVYEVVGFVLGRVVFWNIEVGKFYSGVLWGFGFVLVFMCMLFFG